MTRDKQDHLSHPYYLTMERIHLASQIMTPEETKLLRDWEKDNLSEGGKGTSDWRGWEAIVKRLSH